MSWYWVAVGVALALPLATAARSAESDILPLAHARTAVLDITENYVSLRNLNDERRPVDVPKALPNVALPVRSVVDALVRHAGVELQRDPGAAADLRIVIHISGTTYGQLYDASIGSRRVRELRYTDASLTGTLQFRAGGTVVERRFTGDITPAVSIIAVVDGGDVRRDPNYAPFRAAFEAPGGFLDVLGAAVREIWGDAPLRGALDDRDPLVRDVARRTLE